MECQADEIAELIDDTLGLTGVRAHGLGAFHGTYFRVTISRFGALDARTYVVSIRASDLEHTNSTYMLNTALLPWWGEKPSDGSRVFFTASPCAMEFLSTVLFSVTRWHVTEQ